MTPDEVAHLATRITLPDGLEICLRPILPTDGPLLVDGVARMSPESRYLRFFAPVDHLSAAQIEYFTHVDYVDHFAWVATLPNDHRPELGLGVARYVRSNSDPSAAEAAVAVTDDFHRRGIGSVLLESLAAVALSNGIVAFHLLVHFDNRPMIAAMTELGAVPVADDDYTVVRYVLDLPQLAADLRGTPMWKIFRLVGSAGVELHAPFRRDG